MEEDYDMVPHDEILNLKKEVNDLKIGTGSEIRKAMQALTASVNKMNEILKEAAQGMKTEESEAMQLNKKIGLLIDKLDVITDENKKIAGSMISFAELIKERFPVQQPGQAQRMIPPKPIPSQPAPRIISPIRAGPPKAAPMPAQQNMPHPLFSHKKGLPPLPPNITKKKGLFGKLVK